MSLTVFFHWLSSLHEVQEPNCTRAVISHQVLQFPHLICHTPCTSSLPLMLHILLPWYCRQSDLSSVYCGCAAHTCLRLSGAHWTSETSSLTGQTRSSPEPASFSLASHQDAPPQPSPVPAPSPGALTAQPVPLSQRLSAIPSAPLLGQAPSSSAGCPLGLTAGTDSDWGIVPTTGLLPGSQHWTTSICLLPTMPPQLPQTQPNILLYQALPPAHWLSWGQQPALLHRSCPILTPKVPSVQDQDAAFKGKTWSSLLTSTATSWPQAPPPQHSRGHAGLGLPHTSHQVHSRGAWWPSGLQLPKYPGPRGRAPSSGPRAPHPPCLNWLPCTELCARTQGLPTLDWYLHSEVWLFFNF